MDVSISSVDKQAREAFIKARDEKQDAKDRRAQDRKDRKRKKSDHVTMRRLQRRITKEVRATLLNERKLFLTGEATGGEHYIDTRIRHKRKTWRYGRSSVEKLLNEALAKHSGFEYKVDYDCDGGYRLNDPDKQWCDGIEITYTLLNS